MAKVEAGDTPTGASAAVEIELKLCGEPAVLERLWQAPLLRRPGAAAPRVKQLENVYYDTVDLRLRRRGLAFRIRRDGNRFIQTRSEEHTSELQSLMRISYAVFCLKQKKQQATKRQ